MDKLYITGYATSGKSTYADKMKKKGYYILHLDELIRNDVNKKFNKLFNFALYKKIIPDELINNKVDLYFIKMIRKYLKSHKKIILEGQIKNEKLLKQIFKNYDYEIHVLRPKNKTIYKKRIISRFIDDPANYGRLGFLYNEDNKINRAGLNDYIKNGIKGKIINKIINKMVKETYYKHKEYMEIFINYKNVKFIIN